MNLHFTIPSFYKTKFMLHSERDWAIIVVVFSFLIFLAGVWSGYLFLQISKGEIFIVSKIQNTPVETISREDLRGIIEMFEKRALTFEDIEGQKKYFIDPSL